MRDASPADRKRGFQTHAFVFVVSIIVLFIINYFTGTDYIWAFWPLLGWGIGLLGHWWFVMGPGAARSDVSERQG
jgi:hypothetical protein